MFSPKSKQISGWIAVIFSTAITSFWSFWGIIENFHEGWFHETLFENLKLMFVQYLSPMFAFLIISAIAIYKPRIGSVLHLILMGVLIWILGGVEILRVGVFGILIFLPLLILAVLYWFGEPQPKKYPYLSAIGLPLMILLIGISPAIRVSQRVFDGDLGERLIEGNGVKLLWAGEGFGFPQHGGKNWDEAKKQCQNLSQDGKTLMETPQNIWRLPTVDEAVRSMSLHGKNSGGIWNPDTKQSTYEITPDKESPLWNVYSPVIYWWTATEVDGNRAYRIVYDGKVFVWNKKAAPDYFSFRCVREP
jgi:hypothetical protein